jgi:GrpB-like predicted nucleotidyltransferase (UPF0157 family)
MERDPNDIAAYDESLAKSWVGPPPELQSKIEIVEYDPEWPKRYEREAAHIHDVLGARLVRLEHVGSTSVPALPAKPIIDMVLEVPDSADEPSYLPDFEAAGYVLVIRESEWYEHRVFKGPEANINLHVFSSGCEETERMVLFRDWLRGYAADRELYAAAKRDLAARDWKYVQQYADAKTAIVAEIMSRAEAARQGGEA